MKICENCNLSFDDGKKFCFKCGSPLTTVDQMVAKAEKIPPKAEYSAPKPEKYKSGGWKYSSPIETNKPVFERIPKAESIDERSEHQSSPSATLFAQAQIFLKNNQLENAIEKFRVLYEEGQQDKIVILYVGIGEALLSDYHHAMMLLGPVLNERNNGLSLVDMSRGYLYMAFSLCQTSAGFLEVNKWVSRINYKVLDENLNINDVHANVIITEYMVSRCLRKINKPSDAREQMAELIKTYLTDTNFTANGDTGIAGIWYNIGMKYIKFGLFDEALNAFQEAIFFNPDENKYGKKVSEMEKTIVAKSRKRKKKVLSVMIAATLIILMVGFLFFQQDFIMTKIFGIDKTHVVNSKLNIVTDINGNVYHTVKIGTQVWMIENLKTTKYRNGDPIPYVSDSSEWDSLTVGAYNYYNNDENLGRVYGYIYNSYAVADSRGLAPEGWHIPSDEEWEVLVNNLGGKDVAGGKLKESGTDYWYNNQDASNSSGFTALPGGCFDPANSFSQIGYSAHFWTVPDSSGIKGEIDFYLINSKGSANRYLQILKMGKSVRCIKDISE
ncbi:MAG: FISUMP domain-containing protein [Bacteroidales bacterium]|nr:hypothetical protein [Bacteroidales bacterium]